MSRPALKTYGRAPRTSSFPSATLPSDPYPYSSSPHSFRLDTPPSSPPPAKRARITPPSSPLLARSALLDHSGSVADTQAGELESSLKGGNGCTKDDAKSKSAGSKLGQATLKGFFSANPKPAPVAASASAGPSSLSLKPLLESKRCINRRSPSTNAISQPRSVQSTSISKPSMPLPGPAKRAAPASQTQLRLTHLPLLHTCKDCLMSYVRGGEDEAVHAKHHGRVIRGIPWDGLGRGRSVASGSGSNVAKVAGLNRNGSGGVAVMDLGKSGPGWKEVEERTFIAATVGGRGGRVKVRVIECEAGYGGAKLEEILALVDLSLSSPALPQAILDRCKVYLAITSSPPPISGTPIRSSASSSMKGQGKGKEPKERVVGVVVSQGIKWAMRVLEDETVMKGRAARNESMDEEGGLIKDRPAELEDGVRAYTLDAGNRLTASSATLPDTIQDRHVVTGRSASAPSTHGRQRQSILRLPGVSRRSTGAPGDTTNSTSAPSRTMTDTAIPSTTAPEADTSGLQIVEGDTGILGQDLEEIRSFARCTAATVSHRGTRSIERQASAAVDGMVDSGDGVMCDPTPLPTPLGIHRLYTIPSYRSLGIAEALLDVACLHTIYACPARPEKGQVAFSQPTQSGARMMRRWGKGGVRVFVDDESQL